MHPTARRCIGWAITLFVLGAILIVYVPDIYVAIVGVAGSNAEIGVDLVDVILTLVRWTTMPTGAALIGAAVVIEALTSDGQRSSVEQGPEN